MNTTSFLDTIPISSLNALEYCPRSFYYQVVQGETMVNEFVLEGKLAHTRVHQSGSRITQDGAIETTNLYLYSETLHLTGFADVVEERAGMLIPVEYKRGQQGQQGQQDEQDRQGNWLNEHIQLCAQALCLEERQQGRHVPFGYIYYVSSQRRVQVPFTPQLRARTRAAIAQAFELAARETPPPPLPIERANRCPPCSLYPICLPDEVRQLRSHHER